MHSHHPILITILTTGVVQWLFSAIVCSMPALPPNANYGLKWLYAFLHAAAANVDKVHIPGTAGDLAAQPKDK